MLDLHVRLMSLQVCASCMLSGEIMLWGIFIVNHFYCYCYYYYNYDCYAQCQPQAKAYACTTVGKSPLTALQRQLG